MDLVEGETLRAILEREKRLHEARAARLVSQVLDALEEAHDAGLVHRDLKPENLIVTQGRRGEEIRLLDFGIAKAVAASRDATGGLTASGTTLGTLCYMSPEQDEGKKLDGRSDLYSLGVILYECVSGRRPIEPDADAEDPVQSFHVKLATLAPEPLASAAPGVSAEFAAAVGKALAKNRDGRFATAVEMREALVSVAAHLSVEPVEPVSGAATATGLPTMGHERKRELLVDEDGFLVVDPIEEDDEEEDDLDALEATDSPPPARSMKPLGLFLLLLLIAAGCVSAMFSMLRR